MKLDIWLFIHFAKLYNKEILLSVKYVFSHYFILKIDADNSILIKFNAH